MEKNLICPVCSNEQTEAFSATRQTDYYRFCPSCRCFFLHDFSLFGSIEYDASYVLNIDQTDSYGKLFKRFLPPFQYNVGKESGSFLEVGFANPTVCLEAARSGWEVTAVDITCPERAKIAFNHAGVKVIEGDIRQTNLPEKYDVIWMTHLIEHFTVGNAQLVLSKLRDALTDDGIIFVSSPDASCYYTDDCAVLYSNCKPQEHVVLYSPEAFVKLVKKIGLERRWMDIHHNPEGNNTFRYLTKGEWRMCLKKLKDFENSSDM